jgi:hypothetical protein
VECSNPLCQDFSPEFSDTSGGFMAKAKEASKGMKANFSNGGLSFWPLHPGAAYSKEEITSSGYVWCTNASKNIHWRKHPVFEYATKFGAVEGPMSARGVHAVGIYFPSKQHYLNWSQYQTDQRTQP